MPPEETKALPEWLTEEHQDDLRTLLDAVGVSLCSGGVHDLMSGEEWPDEVEEILEDMSEACEQLYQAAYALMELCGCRPAWAG